MIVGIDHIGIVGADEASARLFPALGLTRSDRGTAEAYGVHCEFWGGLNAELELVTPAREDSAVSGFLAASGPGLHHIAFEVDDLAAELARLRAAGLVALDPDPNDGARPGMKVVFMHMGRRSGLLVELVEYAGRQRAGHPDRQRIVPGT